MQPARRWIQGRLGPAGARVVEADDGSLVVYDCPEWTARHTRSLQAVCPDADVDYQASGASLSRFVVVVRRPHRAPLMAVTGLLGLLLAALAFVHSRLGT